MIKQKVIGLFILLGIFCNAQQNLVTGKVVDEKNQPLPGVSVVIKNSQKGTTTDFDGKYSIKAKEGDVLVFSFIGMVSKEVTVQSSNINPIKLNVQLKPDSQMLDDIVVTGVAKGTATKKLGFVVKKIKTQNIQEVPAPSIGGALRGKVSGVTIISSSGDPNGDTSIRLRGSTSIMGSQQPLIIIDGIITGTNTNLNDINMEDVESIEVVKGAAASSMYGSLAGNGVIQIITKRGKGTTKGSGKPIVTFRSEYGFSQISNTVKLANTHRYKLDDTKSWDLNNLDNQGKWVLSSGARVRDEDGLLDNPYPQILDLQKEFFTNKPNYTNYVSLAAAGEKFNYHLSFQQNKQGGVIRDLKPTTRNNIRLNFDYNFNEKLSLKTSGAYTDVESYSAGDNIFKAWAQEPWIDYTAKDSDGKFNSNPKGLKYLADKLTNPLYDIHRKINRSDRQRIMLNSALNYQIFENLSAGASISYDQSRGEKHDYTPKDYVYPQGSRNNPEGKYSITNNIITTRITDFHLSFNDKFDDFNVSSTFKYLYEDRMDKMLKAVGQDFKVSGVNSLKVSKGDNREIDSYEKPERVENFFLEGEIDWKDKLIFNGLVRRDKSSLFGKENRTNYFGRAALSYILTEDIQIDNIDFLKFRASYGTSGNRPTFEAQYETYGIDKYGNLEASTLGNKNLKPSIIKELEIGFDMNFLERFTLSFSYANSDVKNDFIKKPLPDVLGFPNQWVNIGRLGYTSFELELGASIIKTDDMSWDVSLSWDRLRQEVKDLGGINAFNRVRIFRVEEGKPFGLIYGLKSIKDINQFKRRADGTIIAKNDKVKDTDYVELNKIRASKGLEALDPTKLKASDFEINEQGYVILKGSKNTKYEQVFFETDKDGNELKKEIGNTNSDWNMGFTTNFTYKNFGMFLVMDYHHGGDIYNYKKQVLYSAERHKDQENYANQGKHITYSNEGSNMYRMRTASSIFIEDGTYAKIRELAISYTIPKDNVQKWFKVDFLDDIKFSLIGRNLYTITNYSGQDPEISYSGSSYYGTGSPTNHRVDMGAYPQFRSFSASVQINF